GPRHLTFSPDQQFVYILNELSGTVDVYHLNEAGEIADHVQQITTDDRPGYSGCAEIRLSPDGKFLYASNRAETNSISVFSRAQLRIHQLLHVISAGRRSPPNFNFSPDGTSVIVANHQSTHLCILPQDPECRLLTFSSMKVDIPPPDCIVN